ncbi:MAG: YdeI/OmpD-associated family protein [Candidatus Longimicrobiales bacterium M2_2A_002]
MEEGEAVFFETQADFGAWLAEHHDSVDVQWVGFWKKATGKPSITWPESVEQAICWGWIDGLRRSIDDEAYMIRFTPRRPDSHWSRKNVETYRRLEEEGRIEASGRAAWEARDPENTGRASYERERAELSDGLRAMLDAVPEAAAWFDDQPPGYRKTATWWVVSAKREETRTRRMKQLVEDSAAGRKIKPLRR